MKYGSELHKEILRVVCSTFMALPDDIIGDDGFSGGSADFLSFEIATRLEEKGFCKAERERKGEVK